jgi:hypothetical protein
VNTAVLEVEEGFVDLTVPVDHWERLPDGTVSVRACGLLGDAEIGFTIDVLPKWQRQEVKDQDLVIYWGKARYRSLGKASDRFLHILVDQYGLPGHERRMAPIVEFTAAGFQTNPQELLTSPVTMKLFFEPGPREAYAEVFTNIDIPRATIEFREKDPEYRVPLIAALDGIFGGEPEG